MADSLLPTFDQFLNPLLDALRALGGSARPGEAYAHIAETLQLTEDQLAEQNQDGTSKFENRVAWARFYLAKAGYIDSSRWGVWALTEKARMVDTFSRDQIDQLLRDVQSRSIGRTSSLADQEPPVPIQTEQDSTTPEAVRGDYREVVLRIVRTLPPAGFERLCQRLLRESGFQQVRVTGRSGDQGVDGIGVLSVNPFVSFKVLFQCKRYTGVVGPAEVRDFRGAMTGRADKGLIITTGTFSTEARVSLPRPQLQDPGRRCGGQSRANRSPGQQSRRGTHLTLGPLAEPEEASGRLRAESQIEPWFASRERDACIRPAGSGVESR